MMRVLDWRRVGRRRRICGGWAFVFLLFVVDWRLGLCGRGQNQNCLHVACDDWIRIGPLLNCCQSLRNLR